MTKIACCIFFVLALGLGGCGELRSGPCMYHEVSVPKEFRGGRAWVGDISDHERYVEAYERGWWGCIEEYARDIDYQSREADKIGVGWPAAVQGTRKGFEDAEARIKENILRYGKKRTREYLVEIWEAK